MVELSPWPITTAISIFSLLLSFILTFQVKEFSGYILILSIISTIYSSYKWWNDIIIEGSFKGEHTKSVQYNLNTGFYLFVFSEVLIFASFFFAYFYNSLIPSPYIFGNIYPPLGIESLDFKSVPLLNTAVLFFSGISITAAQNYLIARNKNYSLFYLFLTILLGLFFIYLQYFEYLHSFFSISDSVYGSAFFLLTGFHGGHMVIGVIFLGIMFFRLFFNHFFSSHSLGFSFAAIYYHFIDAVWLFLYSILYIWGS